MNALPKTIPAAYVSLSDGIYGYVLTLPKGYEVLETKITKANQMDMPSQKQYVVGIRLRIAT